MIQCTFSIAQLHISVNSRAPTSMLRQSAFQPEAEPEPEFVMVAAPLWVDDLSTPWMVNGYNIDRGVDMMPVFCGDSIHWMCRRQTSSCKPICQPPPLNYHLFLFRLYQRPPPPEEPRAAEVCTGFLSRMLDSRQRVATF